MTTLSKRLATLLTAETVTLGITLAGLIGTGGVAYGHFASKQDELEQRVSAVEQAPTDIAALKADQAAIKNDIAEIRHDQRAILDAVVKRK